MCFPQLGITTHPLGLLGGEAGREENFVLKKKKRKKKAMTKG